MDPTLDTIGTSSIDAVTLPSWSGLDDAGSGTTNVASDIFSAAGHLVAAQLNRTALLTSTGAKAQALTNAKAASANSWSWVVVAGVAALAIGAVIWAVKRS
jgi:hypothetical protein